MKYFCLFISSIIISAFLGCTSDKSSENQENFLWYESDQKVNDSLVDVFYLVSTEILEEKDEQGNDSYIGKLTPEEIESIKAEMNYARKLFGDSLNFFSPYYSQFTMSSMNLSEDRKEEVRKIASKSASDAFQYYLRNLNQGRPFILAGFSQGAMHLLDILRDMNNEDYSRMIAAYCMGYRLTATDLSHPNIIAAQNADDRGVVISYNSVATTEAIWDEVSADAATCINPVNYRTDEVPASIIFKDDTLYVKVDTTYNVLVVNSTNISNYYFPLLDAYCKPGNLHHWDLLFYRDSIRNNALRRAYR